MKEFLKKINHGTGIVFYGVGAGIIYAYHIILKIIAMVLSIPMIIAMFIWDTIMTIGQSMNAFLMMVREYLNIFFRK